MAVHVKDEAEGRRLTAQVESHLLFRIQRQKCHSVIAALP